MARFKNKIKTVTPFLKKEKTTRALALILIFLIPVLSVFVITWRLKQRVRFRPGATGQIKVFLIPERNIMPPEAFFQVWINTDTQLAFSHLEITFDREKVHLVEPVSIPAESPLQRIVKISGVDEANGLSPSSPTLTTNTEGRIVIALALNPEDKNKTQSNLFPIAGLTFTPVTSTTFPNIPINFDRSTIQIVGLNGTAYSSAVNTVGALLDLNPIGSSNTPAPSSIPTAAPSSLPTAPASTGCDNFCKANRYSSGICRQNSRQCTRSEEVYVSKGDAFCLGGKEKACCCK